MARLFISYNHRDAPYAFALRQWLLDVQSWAEREIFVDAQGLTAGVEWHPELLAEAESAQGMLFLASEHALNINSFCYTEVQSAKTRQFARLDVEPTEEFAYRALAHHPGGVARLNRACGESLGRPGVLRRVLEPHRQALPVGVPEQARA